MHVGKYFKFKYLVSLSIDIFLQYLTLGSDFSILIAQLMVFTLAANALVSPTLVVLDHYATAMALDTIFDILYVFRGTPKLLRLFFYNYARDCREIHSAHKCSIPNLCIPVIKGAEKDILRQVGSSMFSLVCMISVLHDLLLYDLVFHFMEIVRPKKQIEGRRKKRTWTKFCGILTIISIFSGIGIYFIIYGFFSSTTCSSWRTCQDSCGENIGVHQHETWLNMIKGSSTFTEEYVPSAYFSGFLRMRMKPDDGEAFFHNFANHRENYGLLTFWKAS